MLVLGESGFLLRRPYMNYLPFGDWRRRYLNSLLDGNAILLRVFVIGMERFCIGELRCYPHFSEVIFADHGLFPDTGGQVISLFCYISRMNACEWKDNPMRIDKDDYHIESIRRLLGVEVDCDLHGDGIARSLDNALTRLPVISK